MPTRRRRFRWAAWWTAPPEAEPFRKPDASSGGARTRADAKRDAERAAGRPLAETEARWAGAWVRVLRGEAPWPEPRAEKKSDAKRTAPDVPKAASAAGGKAWAREILGITSSATAEEVTRAFRAAAFRTHPDRGGSEAAFIAVRKAYEMALESAKSSPRKRRRAR